MSPAHVGSAPTALTGGALPPDRPPVARVAAEASAGLQEALGRLSLADREPLQSSPLEASLGAVQEWPPGHHSYVACTP